MKKVYIKSFPEYSIVYDDLIISREGGPGPGDVVYVYHKSGKFIGSAFYNPHSRIALRIFSFKEEDFDYEYIKKALLRAYNYRKHLGFNETFRLVYSEVDFMPGLIIDKYKDGFVFQVFSIGIEIRKQLIIKALIEIFNPLFIYEKSTGHLRKLEGLPYINKLHYGEIPENYIIKINNINFKFFIGQKTSLFLDQAENYLKLSNYIQDNFEILDAFCYVGGFGLHFLKKKVNVVFLDISENALNILKENLTLNEINGSYEIVCSDVFDYLKNCNKKFDFIILDPPAFTKSKQKLENALKAYDRLHKLAINLLNENGYLATFSCSFYITAEHLIESIKKVSKNNFIILESLYQSKDHPWALKFSESLYLKGFLLKRI